MKIIHLSDTHVGRDNNGLRLQALLDDIAELGDPAEFVVVHTGDLNDNGRTGTMQQGSALLNGLADQGWRVLLAPGNHDYGDALHTDPQCAAQFAQHFGRCLFGLQAPVFPVLTLVDDCALIGLDSNAAGLS